ncbi:MAG: chromosome segregation protein SMC, partial [Candidatus Omnitrophica bacterium]|nr:chromosome segregation protein SMC [Candidatus Omnitrophota bacterium]
MSLKKIEIFGFKSFADRTEIVFEPGVTCVVGPNGCGKSNISDSIRWVLGERSAKMLRGSKMEDVIFSGTDIRKSLGFCEVHLTIDNSRKILPIEYEEVVLSRKMYRTGESEYFINKTSCRFKDVQDLILDTGIGSNSYSMIEQGRIDYILQADPEERRFLIEEAAGISKFKSKKDEALKKLGKTEENLLRLADIIAEVEKNIKYAERQAKRAEKYREQFETLKQLEAQKAFWQLANIETRQKELGRQKAELAQECEKLEKDFSQQSEVLKQNREKIRLLESEVNRGELKKIELSTQTGSLRDKIYFNVERVGSLKNQWLDAESEIASSEERMGRLTLESEKQENEIVLRQSELSTKQEHTVSIQETLRKQEEQHASSFAKLTEFRQQQAQNDSIRQKLIQEQASLESRIAAMCARSEQQNKEKETLRNEVRALEGEVRNMEQKQVVNYEQKSLLEETLGVVNENIHMKEHELESILSRILRTEGKKKEISVQIEFLSKSLTSRETNNLCRRLDEKRKDPSSGLAGNAWLLKEIVRAKPGHESVLEQLVSVLSPEALIVHVDVFFEFKELISRSASSPVSVLFTHSHVTPVQHPGIPLEWKGTRLTSIQDSLELISEAQTSAQQILQGILISSASAEQLISLGIGEITQNKQVLSREGVLFGPGSLVTFPVSAGGNFSQETIRELEAEKDLLEHQFVEYEKREKAIKQEKTSMSHDQFKVQEDVAKIRTEIESELRRLDLLKESIGRIQERVDRLDEETSQSEHEITDIRQSISEKTGRIQTLEEEGNALEPQAVELSNFTKASAQTLESLRLEQVREETSLIALKEKLSMAKSYLEEVREGIVTESQRVQQKRKNILDAKGNIELLTEENNKFSLEIDALAASQSQIEIELGRCTDQLLEHRAICERIEIEVETRRQHAEKTREELHQTEFKAMESTYSKNSIFDRLRQTYKIDLEKLKQPAGLEEMTEETIQEITTQIEGLQERVESYGAVNLLAVDEYNELKTRYDFMVTQKNDLTGARDALLDAIRKINKTTKKLFEDTFQKVQINFQEFFTLLFGGGHAELILLDQENALESGIEVMVRPPGKKLQQISLLSGGEKALTAVALLFALFKIKPSPFCVLDEVDAPLDEANIDRFLSVLKIFLELTQFIIITHNRKTISMGDALYG